MTRRGTGGPMDSGPANRAWRRTVIRGVILAIVAGVTLYAATHGGVALLWKLFER